MVHVTNRPRHRLVLDGVDDANRQEAVRDGNGDFASADRHVEPPHVQRVREVHGDVRRTWRETRERDTPVGVGRAAAVRRVQRECDQGRRTPSDQTHRQRGHRVVRSGRYHDTFERTHRRRDSERCLAGNDDACARLNSGSLIQDRSPDSSRLSGHEPDAQSIRRQRHDSVYSRRQFFTGGRSATALKSARPAMSCGWISSAT
jgi:hypothetical protein